MHIEREYVDIGETLSDFAAAYAELKTLKNDLTLCLRGKITVLNEDSADQIAGEFEKEAPLDDAKYVSMMAKAVSARDPVSSLVMYVAIINRLASSVSESEHRVKLMTDRINGSGSSDNEVAVAEKRRKQYEYNAEVYRRRIVDVATKFYKLRLGIFGKLCTNTKKFKSITDGLLLKEIDKLDKEYAITPDKAAKIIRGN